MLCTIPGEGEGAEFLEAELVNVSSSGMLLASGTPLPIGAVVDFQFKLDDGLVALSGRAEVVRTVSEPPRMGLRFVTLDGAARTLVQRLIEASDAAPEVPTAPGSRRPPSSSNTDRSACGSPPRPPASSRTTRCCTWASGVASCPRRTTFPSGPVTRWTFSTARTACCVRCKAKVAAKQDRWIGVRFIGFERSALLALRAEIAKLASPRDRGE